MVADAGNVAAAADVAAVGTAQGAAVAGAGQSFPSQWERDGLAV